MKLLTLNTLIITTLMACNSNKKPSLAEGLQKQHEENLRKFDSLHGGNLTEAEKRQRDSLAGYIGNQPVFHQSHGEMTMPIGEIKPKAEKPKKK